MKFQLKVMFAFAAIYLIWGSTYLAILYVIRDMPPILMSGLRFLLAGLILLVWCIVKGEKLPERSSVIKNAICGILMLLGGTGAVVDGDDNRRIGGDPVRDIDVHSCARGVGAEIVDPLE